MHALNYFRHSCFIGLVGYYAFVCQCVFFLFAHAAAYHRVVLFATDRRGGTHEQYDTWHMDCMYELGTLGCCCVHAVCVCLRVLLIFTCKMMILS